MNPLHILLALLITSIWGFNFIAMKFTLLYAPPLLLCSIRFILTSIPAIFFIKKPGINFFWLLLYGFFMFTLHFTFIFMGIHQGVSPGLASLIVQSQLFFSIFLAVLFLKEKLMPWHILGGLVAFTGMYAVWIHLDEQSNLTGFIFLILAALACGFGNLIAKKIGRVSALSLVVWSAFFAFPPLLIMSFLIEGVPSLPVMLATLTPVTISALFYTAFVSTGIGYWGWNFLLARYPVASVSPFLLMVPVFGLLSSVIIFKEPLNQWKLFAAGLILSGLCINLLGPKLWSRFSRLIIKLKLIPSHS